jgi:hypothetical protein
MRRLDWITGAIALLLGVLPLLAAGADFEVSGPGGRRILLKEDGTWQYIDTGQEQAKGKPAETGEAVLTLEHKTEAGPNCRFGFRLSNNLPYEIWSIVPSFSAYRPGDVLYETRSIGFVSIKPGNSQSRSTEFRGITCQEIDRLQVSGGDRCEMGELTRFSNETGACLAKVRVDPSELVRFGK